MNKDIEIELENWYNKSKADPNKWNRGLGKKIKEILKRTNNFKYYKRGNPRKSKVMSDYNRLKRAGAELLSFEEFYENWENR